jgi:hypothetical protein
MGKSWNNRRPQRRPPLPVKKPERQQEMSVPQVPAGIELNPIAPEIIQSVKDLLATRGVDVETFSSSLE